MKKNSISNECRVENIYQLDGRVPIQHAIPFGLQHVLAMFVANLTPVMLVTGVARFAGSGVTGISQVDLARLLQSCMFIAGVGTLVQLYPVWVIGSRLPVVMGVSFSFLSSLIFIVTNFDYQTMVGAVIVGGLIEGMLGLCYKFWKNLISPIVSACVVTAIGLSLLNVGAKSFGGGEGIGEQFGSWEYIIVGTITLVACILFNIFTKGFWKQLSILFGLIIGYVVSMIFGIVDFSVFNETIDKVGFVSFPRFLPYFPKFNLSAIVAVVIIYLVSAAETIGDTSAVVAGGLNRDITEKEIQGSLTCDGFCSALSGMFGCTPITSFSQNVGLVAMTKVVNRYTIMFGALTLILAGIVPPIGAFFSTLPQPVLGGCTIMMFGTIVISGMEMIAKCGFSQRNIVIVALSISIGIGFTEAPGIFSRFPSLIQDVFAGNSVAGVFVVAMVLNLLLPKNMDMETIKQK